MASLFNKLRCSLVLRIGLIYAIMALFLVQFVDVAISYSWLPETVGRTTAILAVIYFFFVLLIAWLVQAVEPPDRLVLFKQIIWVYGPIFFLVGPLTLYVIYIDVSTFFLTTNNANPETASDWQELIISLLLLLSFVAATTWMLMSARVARAWAIQRAQDPESILQAEEKLLGGLRYKDAEARISPKMYYTFLASVAAMFFLVVEILISEFFDETIGLPGYTGALVAALGIAAFIYPIHKRASKFITLVNDFEKESDVEDAKSAAAEIASALLRYFTLDVPHGYIGVVIALIISLVIAAVKLYPLF